MRVKIESTVWYEPEEMLERYPCLAKFGFHIDEKNVPKRMKIRDENGKLMDFEYGTKTIYTPMVDINGMQDVVDLMNAVGSPIIVNNEDKPYSLEIYDGLRE